MKELKKGVLIVFEGGECSGKSTLQKNCFDYFSKDYDTVKMREPGTAKVSEGIRNLLLNPDMQMSSMTELLLYEAARAQFVHDILIPALEEKKLILCDRFYYSTIAYQGFGRGIDIKTIESLNNTAAQGIKSDILFIVDVPYEESMKRLENSWRKKDRLEKESRKFHEDVRRGYNYIADNYKESILLDGCRELDTVAEDVIKRTEEYLEHNKLFK
jgi:dTMP kinase